MTLLFIDGFDHYDPGTPSETAQKGWTTHVNFTTATGRSGSGNSMFLDGGTGLDATRGMVASSEFIVGFAFNMELIPVTGSFQILYIRSGGSVSEAYLYINSAGQLECRDRLATTIWGTSTVGLVANTWYYIEYRLLSSNTVGEVELYVNGVQEVNVGTLDTRGTGDPDTITLRCPAAVYGWKCDDFYLLDTTGSVNNDFLGEVKVATIYPDGDVTNDWTAVGTGTTNADRVDEAAADGDTTYVHSSTAAEQERYDYEALPTDSDVVHGVQVVPLTRKVDDGGSRTFRTTAYSVATESTGSTVGLGDSYLYYPQIYELDPDASAAWTETTVNAAKFGYEIVA